MYDQIVFFLQAGPGFHIRFPFRPVFRQDPGDKRNPVCISIIAGGRSPERRDKPAFSLKHAAVYVLATSADDKQASPSACLLACHLVAKGFRRLGEIVVHRLPRRTQPTGWFLFKVSICPLTNPLVLHPVQFHVLHRKQFSLHDRISGKKVLHSNDIPDYILPGIHSGRTIASIPCFLP